MLAWSAARGSDLTKVRVQHHARVGLVRRSQNSRERAARERPEPGNAELALQSTAVEAAYCFDPAALEPMAGKQPCQPRAREIVQVLRGRNKHVVASLHPGDQRAEMGYGNNADATRR